MATFVTMAKFTAQGIGSFKDTVKRSEKATAAAESLGGQLKTILWLQGEYDVVLITEFPDDETQAAYSAGLAMQGSVTTTTMRAFTAQDVERIIQKLP